MIKLGCKEYNLVTLPNFPSLTEKYAMDRLCIYVSGQLQVTMYRGSYNFASIIGIVVYFVKQERGLYMKLVIHHPFIQVLH